MGLKMGLGIQVEEPAQQGQEEVSSTGCGEGPNVRQKVRRGGDGEEQGADGRGLCETCQKAWAFADVLGATEGMSAGAGHR